MPLTLLKIQPDKIIEFPLVLYQSSTVELKLTNVSESNVAFKIKTTAPKSYLVRPSTGILAPTSSIKVHIVLQPLMLDPTTSGNSDRFLVQAIGTDLKPNELTKRFWDIAGKDGLEDQRLTVVFIKDPSQPDSLPGNPATAEANGEKHARTARGISEGGGDFEQKYNALLQYTEAVERQQGQQLKEIESLKNELRAASRSNPGGLGAAGMNSFHKVSCTKCGNEVSVGRVDGIGKAPSTQFSIKQTIIMIVIAIILTVVMQKVLGHSA